MSPLGPRPRLAILRSLGAVLLELVGEYVARAMDALRAARGGR